MVSIDVKLLEDKSWSDQENETMDNQNSLLQIDEHVEILGQEVPPPEGAKTRGADSKIVLRTLSENKELEGNL